MNLRKCRRRLESVRNSTSPARHTWRKSGWSRACRFPRRSRHKSLMTVCQVEHAQFVYRRRSSLIVFPRRDQRSEHQVISTVAHSLIRGLEPHCDHTSEGCLYLRSEVPLKGFKKTCRRIPSTWPRCSGRWSRDLLGKLGDKLHVQDALGRKVGM